MVSLGEVLLSMLPTKQAVLIHRKISHFKALLLQIFHGIVYGCMFHRSSNQMIAASFVSHGTSDQRQIVGLCSAGCKINLFFIYFQVFCKKTFCLPDIMFRFHALVCMEEGFPKSSRMTFITMAAAPSEQRVVAELSKYASIFFYTSS